MKNIYKMTRNWFLDNDLQMSYKSEDERVEIQDRTAVAWDKIMKYNVSRLSQVQTEIKRLDTLKYNGASDKEIKKQNDKLIAACRTYMKNTSLPAEGDSLVRLGLKTVSIWLLKIWS